MSNILAQEATEDDLDRMIREIREEMIRQWIHDDLDLEEVAIKAGLCGRTVLNFRAYVTKRPTANTFLRIAYVIGIKVIRLKVPPQNRRRKKK